MKSCALSGFIVVFLKDRLFLTRLQKLGSISVFRSRSKGPMLIPYHSNRLLPLVVADSASSFYDTKINKKLSGLVKEAFSNASKFDLLSVKIIVEPGSFDAKADASSSAIDSDRKTLVSDESRMVC